MTTDPHRPARQWIHTCAIHGDDCPVFAAGADHADRPLHPGAPEAIGAALRSLLKLGWVWLRDKTRRKRPGDLGYHEAWCPNTDGTRYCECWRFLLEADPSAERFMTEYDDDQRRDR